MSLESPDSEELEVDFEPDEDEKESCEDGNDAEEGPDVEVEGDEEVEKEDETTEYEN